eukprot:gnl/TRDRNA2_/TRDRNA2_92087_c0_seq1.p1 gnl/TRDRNA2_/TRDRNA2_92087_c0~~gnl/TRDRNA2_/TRDRNA2_92087_c0_seq1.p1  ORF type:complete len:293 (-),score=43.72 gnl/TRDRNA2_/TRDRNA2_92087_c0_seq1:64-942(-)
MSHGLRSLFAFVVAKLLVAARAGRCGPFDATRVPGDERLFSWSARLRERLEANETERLWLSVRRTIDHVVGLYAARGYMLERNEAGGGAFSTVKGWSWIDESIDEGDVELLIRLCELVRPRRIFGIGNAFGFSTLVLSYACLNAPLDVIDIEYFGSASHKGTELTRRIAAEEGRNIHVHVGASPRDTRAALTGPNGTYDLAFIDGYHSNRNLRADFAGLRGVIPKTAVVVCHDVATFKLWQGLRGAMRAMPSARFRTYRARCFPGRHGTGFLYMGYPDAAFRGFGPLLPVVP